MRKHANAMRSTVHCCELLLLLQTIDRSPLAAWCAHYTTHGTSITDEKAFRAFLLEKLT